MMIKTNRLTIGILAGVDAGKTTLSEAILFRTGTVKSVGRVDHGSAFLDTDSREKARGITIFSKQAVFSLGKRAFTLLDTPGHTDFSAETERILPVIDYGILVISAGDGVTSGVRVLWKLLKQYRVPAFVFINKTDQAGADPKGVLTRFQEECSENCILFDKEDRHFFEKIALCEEGLLEEFLRDGRISSEDIADLVAKRKIFPCFSGSALKLSGIDEFLQGILKYTRLREYPDEFGAKVYKISRDGNGTRLTHMKITGGSLKVKDVLGDEKVNQIRIYSGNRFTVRDRVPAGTVCSVTGPDKTYIGEGLGFEQDGRKPSICPMFAYQILFPAGTDIHRAYRDIALLNEEFPEISIIWNDVKNRVDARLTGDMQKEILKDMVKSRFGFDITFGKQIVLYKETVKNRVEGVGHYETGRQYAEVHLILSPLEHGTGLVFDSFSQEGMADKNLQKLILTCLKEKEHKGVLTGSPVTDMRISIGTGEIRAKRPEGGDLRQAVCRAVRQGLMKAESVLLEPYYDFRLEVPSASAGRALADMVKMSAKHDPPSIRDGKAVIAGKAPVSSMNGYLGEVLSYTKGEGKLSFLPGGYFPCHDTDEVIRETGYDPEGDMENPPGSIFYSGGSAEYVPWNEVESRMSMESCLKEKKDGVARFALKTSPGKYSEEELAEIFLKTYGVSKRDRKMGERAARTVTPSSPERQGKKSAYDDVGAEKVLIVDGYNMIFAWDELKEMAKLNLEAARDLLAEILLNYQGYMDINIILVFDAYNQTDSLTRTESMQNLKIIYTKEDQTADQYIEKYVLENIRDKRITVATSDQLEQMMTFGQGALRVSARELRERVIASAREIREKYLGKNL